jgi:hypothetical protein
VRTAERVKVTCPCGAAVSVTRKDFDAGKGRYCSNTCKYRYRVRPSGLVYVKRKENPTSFQPGSEPWNKGMRGVTDAWNKGVSSGVVPSSAFRPGETSGEGNFRWAGGLGFRCTDLPGYRSAHRLVHRVRGSAKNYPCELADSTCKGPMQWANISHEYRGAEDFMPLCMSHHVRYDAGVM